MQATNEDEEAEDASHGSTTSRSFCTAVLQGQVFQEIYVCRRCCADGACLCQGCAQVCHVDCHLPGKDRQNDNGESDEEEEAVEYIGMGPATCDCHRLAIQIANPPLVAAAPCQCQAASASLAEQHDLVNHWNAACTLPRKGIHKNESIRAFYMDSLLNNPALREELIQQIRILVQHSKDTFWIESSKHCPQESFSLLEHLAYQLLQFHERNDGMAYRGAEWWVQVKEMGTNATTIADAAIEMHYDKDEDLAEIFGIGVFPTLSTVTYLTSGTDAAPTLIFPRTYHDRIENPMPHVYASRPVVGKHLAFDGSLLHGAIPLSGFNRKGGNDKENAVRVTFLVNLWKDHRPMGIRVLPPEICQALVLQTDSDTSRFPPLTVRERRTPIPEWVSDAEEYMTLPFIQNGMVVRTVRLPHQSEMDDDIARINFRKGWEAHLEYPGEDD